MNSFQQLLASGGAWTGTNRVQAGPDAPIETCETRVNIVTLPGGQFVRLDENWSWKGKPKEGQLLIGCDDKGAVSMSWIDTFHTSKSILQMKGKIDDAGKLIASGFWSVGDGSPDWGWRVELSATASAINIVMFVIPPGEADGSEGVWIDLERA